MIETVNKLEELLKILEAYISKSSDADLKQKANPEKWSKKEIIGHLIDSGLNNLQRFTEIQFEEKPYKIRHYARDEWVKVNDYHNSELKEIINFLLAINIRIKNVMLKQNSQTLDYEIDLNYDTGSDNGNMSDLRFLMTDYVEHFEHHLKQIINN